jgi:hypothetical protein
MRPEDLGLRWGERYPVQPVDEYGNIMPLAPCDIVVFGIEIPDPPPDDDEKVIGFSHTATATGNGTQVWQVGENPIVGPGCVAGGCLHPSDANAVLANPIYGWKCVVFPGSAFGDEPVGIASADPAGDSPSRSGR